MPSLTFDDEWHLLAEKYDPNRLHHLLKTDPAITRRPYLHIVAGRLLQCNSDNTDALKQLIEAMLSESPLGPYYKRYDVALDFDPRKYTCVVERFRLELIHIIHPKWKRSLTKVVALEDVTVAKYLVEHWALKQCKSLIPIARNLSLDDATYQIVRDYALSLAASTVMREILHALQPAWCCIS